MPILNKRYMRQKIELIQSIVPKGKLLEIGCGQGILLNELKKYYDVMGCDISQSAVNQAAKLVGEKQAYVFNAEKENIEGIYDIIVAIDLLEHLINPQRCVIKMRNALKKGGVLIISVPNNYGMYGAFMTKCFNFIDKTHINTYKRRYWIEMLKRAKFTLSIYDQSLLGIHKSNFAKHYSFNILMVAKK